LGEAREVSHLPSDACRAITKQKECPWVYILELGMSAEHEDEDYFLLVIIILPAADIY
jgi:hypothetical protein